MKTEKEIKEMTPETVKGWVKSDLKASIVFLEMVHSDDAALDLLVNRFCEMAKIGAPIDKVQE